MKKNRCILVLLFIGFGNLILAQNSETTIRQDSSSLQNSIADTVKSKQSAFDSTDIDSNDSDVLFHYNQANKNNTNNASGHKIRTNDTITRNYELVYDFYKKQFVQDIKRIRYGDGLNFKVINFPRYKYNAELEYEIVTLQTQNQQNDFRSLFGIGDLTKTNDGNGNTQVTAIPKDIETASDSSRTVFLLEKIAAGIKESNLTPVGQKLKKDLKLVTKDQSILDKALQLKEVLSNQKDTISPQYQPDIKTVNDIIEDSEESILKDLYTRLIKERNDFYYLVDRMDSKSEQYVLFTDEILEVKKSNKKYLTILGILKEKKQILDINFIRDFDFFSDQVKALKTKYYNLKELITSIKRQKREDDKIPFGLDLEPLENGLDKNYTRIRNVNYSGAISAVRAVYDEVSNIESYTVNFGKIMAYGDEIDIKFRHYPKENVSGNIEKDFNFPKIIGVYNYWTFDVSTGLLGMSTINENVFNRTDFDSATGSGTKSFTRITQRKKIFNINMGFAGFIQFSYAFSPVVRWGFSVGGGVSASADLNGSFFGGTNLGIKIGRKMLVSFQTGVSFAKSPVLKEKYSDNFNQGNGAKVTSAVFNKDYVEETYTENKIRPGFYLGIAFNLITVKLDKKQ